MAALVERALLEAAGSGFVPTSLSLDYAAPVPAGETLEVKAWVDRATRTVVFAQAEARRASDVTLAAVASGVFRRLEDAKP